VLELPRGTVTFLFTDVEASTELLRQLREEYGRALGVHRSLVRTAVQRHHGMEVDTQGDAFFFAFQRASDGVRAAIDAQRALSEQEWPRGATVRVRMGLHTGEALLEDGRYHGLSVHRAARISGVAHGGQVLLSESTRSLLGDEEELREVGFRDLGQLALKDFERPIRVYRLTAPGLAEVGTRPHSRVRHRRRVVVAAAVLAAAIAAAVVATFASPFGGGRSAVRVPGDSVGVVDPLSGHARAAVAVGQGAVWAAVANGRLARIDPATNAVSSTKIASMLNGVAVDDAAVWAVSGPIRFL